MTLLDRHLAFLGALRKAGLPVSLAEGLDSARAVEFVDLLDRESLRATYAATVVKRQTHRPAFDALFDLWFPPALGDGVMAAVPTVGEPEDDQPRRVEATGGRGDRPEVRALRQELAELLLDGDEAGLQQLVRMAVGRFGQVQVGNVQGNRSWSPSSVLSAMSAETLMAGLLRAVLAGQERGGLAEKLARRTFTDRIARFETLVTAEARRRIAEDKGAEQIAKSSVKPPLEQLDFLGATRADLAALRREIHPLARRLATRMTVDHRLGRRGQLDFRRTIRASLSSGGVPVVTHHKPRRPHRSELVILCDVSESVTSFAHFTLLLTYALREQFVRVRAFAFIDTVDEITRFFAPGIDVVDAMTRMTREAKLTWVIGRTNYGRVFEVFAERYPDAIGARTSLLILGDARANYGDLALPTLKRLAGQARHAYWLNPEPRRRWDSGDSVASVYAGVVPMFECRNLSQLTDFIRKLA